MSQALLQPVRWTILIVIAFVLLQATQFWLVTEARCEPVRSSICRKLGYNFTILPNYFGHMRQKQATKVLHEFDRVRFDHQCSKNIDSFLCSIYFPMCTVLRTYIPPCRSLCLQAKSGCEAVLSRFGYTWPRNLNCDRFPELRSGKTCVFQNRSSSFPSSANHSSPSVRSTDQIIKDLPLRERQKFCWKSSNGANKQCCRYGNKAVKVTGECSLKLSKSLSQKKKRFLRKKREVCLADDTNKLCYQSCCRLKKKQTRQRRKKSRKAKQRRT